MDKPQTEPSIIIITGMHRSGTSLTASLLQSAGLHIGNRLLSPNDGNPKGYFENLDFFELHRRILQARQLDKDGWTFENIINLQEHETQLAHQIVAQNSLGSVWGWKEPRTTLFLSFWANFLPQANFLFVYRCPWEVVDSLYRRGDNIFQGQPELAVKLWVHYNQIILNFAACFPKRCLLANIQQIIQSPKDYIAAITQRFKVELSSPDSKLYDPSGLKTEAEYYHRRALIEECFPQAISTYKELESRAWHFLETPILSKSLPPASDFKIGGFQDWMTLRRLERENQQLKAQFKEYQFNSHQITEQLEAQQKPSSNKESLPLFNSPKLNKINIDLDASRQRLANIQALLAAKSRLSP